MAILTKQQKCIALSMRGKHSRPCGVGNFIVGLSRVGMEDVYAGIYQMRFREKNPLTHELNKKVAKINVIMNWYWPSNIYTRPQHSYCAKFKDAMTAWGALTKEEQEPWIRKGRKIGTRGNALFVKKYMLDNPLEP